MRDNNGTLTITVDIEDWYHLPPITGLPSSKFTDVPSFFNNWNSRYDYLSQPTKKVLDLLQELDIKATFFIVADVVDHYPGLIEGIAGRGHEIACHGLHHACKIDPKTKQPLMTKTEFKERTIEARKILEKASGQEVIGYRAPNAYISGWMVDILEELGFKYDASVSVNSFYNKSDSQLKGVDTRPYYPAKGSLDLGSTRRDILEIPWPYFNFIVKFPTGGGPVLRLLGARYTMLGLRQSLKRGDTTFYFHPIDMTGEDFPLHSSLMQRLFWMIKGNTIENRVAWILSSVRGTIATCNHLIRNEVELSGS
jgi:peptidoglycan-N-acetylglucosamine deacetylase